MLVVSTWSSEIKKESSCYVLHWNINNPKAKVPDIKFDLVYL